MAAERPEKQTVRDLWIDEVCRADRENTSGKVPLYVTLPGAEGRDIQALIDRGVIERSETEAIRDIHSMRVVAIENSPNAVVELKRRFPGLKVIDQPLESLLHSTKSITWPKGEHHQLFRAQVVNFDLNEPLTVSTQESQLWFPCLALIRKVAILHAESPSMEWTLCLTLHGEATWTQDGDKLACCFLAENFSREPSFARQAERALGGSLYRAIRDKPRSAAIRTRSQQEQQRVMTVLVPKRVAFEAHGEGWRVDTIENLRYGGRGSRAPIVTWMMRFEWDPRARAEPDRVYKEALRGTLRRLGRIDSAGTLHRESRGVGSMDS